VKQLLLAAVLAIAIHGLLFYLELPWSKRVPVIPELKTLSIMLTREKKQTPPAPVPPPASKSVIPPASSEPEPTVTPVSKPPEKPTPIRAEEKQRVAVQKKIPALLPPPVVEVKPAPPEKLVAETVLPLADVAPAKEETKAETASSRKSPSVSSEAAPSVTAGGGHIAEARPLYKENPPPYYPNIARKRNAQGTVVILALVNESGKVEDARVETSSGHALLDEAAVTAVKSWEFEPGRRGGVPVKSYVKLPITFQLK
jgi:periplasmic protein TonB